MPDTEELIKTYFNNKDNVVAAYLYGSYATGKEKAFSDIDVGILLKHRALVTAAAEQNACITELGRMLRKDIHPVILNTATETLLEQIFKKGKCLIINNKKEHEKFKMIALSKILDFSYYRRQMQSGFVKGLMEV